MFAVNLSSQHWNIKNKTNQYFVLISLLNSAGLLSVTSKRQFNLEYKYFSSVFLIGNAVLQLLKVLLDLIA
jgi:hypothetical protein